MQQNIYFTSIILFLILFPPPKNPAFPQVSHVHGVQLHTMLEMLLNLTNLACNVLKTIYNIYKMVQTAFHIKINLTGDAKTPNRIAVMSERRKRPKPRGSHQGILRQGRTEFSSIF